VARFLIRLSSSHLPVKSIFTDGKPIRLLDYQIKIVLKQLNFINKKDYTNRQQAVCENALTENANPSPNLNSNSSSNPRAQ